MSRKGAKVGDIVDRYECTAVFEEKGKKRRTRWKNLRPRMPDNLLDFAERAGCDPASISFKNEVQIIYGELEPIYSFTGQSFYKHFDTVCGEFYLKLTGPCKVPLKPKPQVDDLFDATGARIQEVQEHRDHYVITAIKLK